MTTTSVEGTRTANPTTNRTTGKPARSRTVRYRHLQDDLGTLDMSITTGRKVETFHYFLEDHDTIGDEINGVAILRRCFRLTKIRTEQEEGEPTQYDLLIDTDPVDPEQPQHSCECRGFLRWNHCKHTDALAELIRRGKL